MKKCKKIIAFAVACFLLIGGSLTFKADAASIQPRLSTHYCPMHHKAIVKTGEHSTGICNSCGRKCTYLYYQCLVIDKLTGNCLYSEIRCDKCGAEW